MDINKSQENEKLYHWKDLILAAEAYGGTRTEWMKMHGVSKDAYYYWRRALYKRGMLTTGDFNPTEDIQIPPTICLDSKQPASLVEYKVNTVPEKKTNHDNRESGDVIFASSIAINRNGYWINVGDNFSEETLRRVLEVISHAE